MWPGPYAHILYDAYTHTTYTHSRHAQAYRARVYMDIHEHA